MDLSEPYRLAIRAELPARGSLRTPSTWWVGPTRRSIPCAVSAGDWWAGACPSASAVMCELFAAEPVIGAARGLRRRSGRSTARRTA